MTHLLFFDESSPTNAHEAVYDDATETYDVAIGTIEMGEGTHPPDDGDGDGDANRVCATGRTIESGSECALQVPQGTPDAGLKFGRFAVGVQLGSEKGCVYIGSGFVSCTTSSISEQGTITAPSGNKYPFDFAANKIEDSSSWRLSKLSITLQ